MEDGDFLLMDYAPDYGYYESDVTRMFPVNGKFSPWQRELYGFYLACYRAILEGDPARHDGGQEIMQEAGAEMEQILAVVEVLARTSHRKARREVRRGLQDRGRERERVARPLGRHGDARRRPAHGPAQARHGLHDRAGPDRAEEKIYVRLEDMVFISDKGAEVISTDAPWDIDAIEKAMKEEGMLKKYPREFPPPGSSGAPHPSLSRGGRGDLRAQTKPSPLHRESYARPPQEQTLSPSG